VKENANQKSRLFTRKLRHERVRKRVKGVSSRPRLSVYKSLTGIYAQIINDEKRHTLVSASTIDSELRQQMKGLTKTQQARLVGLKVAERAKKRY
jgi:large subunit ribosomal protein L18